jgi:hypothetical protein
VAVNAGFASLLGFFMITGSKTSLAGEVHGGKIMTVAAFAGVRFLHGLPDMFGQIQPFGFKFFRRINRANQPMKQFVGGLDFSYDLWCPFPWHMTIRTGSLDTGRIRIVHRLFVFLVNRGFHFVARNTKCQRVGGFHCRVEAAPENHAHSNECDDSEEGIFLVFHETKRVNKSM